jgi:hypothetical protein
MNPKIRELLLAIEELYYASTKSGDDVEEGIFLAEQLCTLISNSIDNNPEFAQDVDNFIATLKTV